MQPSSQNTPILYSGRWQYRLRSTIVLYWAMLYVTIRRLMHGPHFPNWSWMFELANHFIKLQTNYGFDKLSLEAGREYEDSLLFRSAAAAQMQIEAVSQPVKGDWLTPKTGSPTLTLLYLHGGGYAYYSKTHLNLISLVGLAAEAKTFALDYRLIPEHPYPAQLEDALAAYRWLLNSGVSPDRLVVAGDSAGGNLTLALLLTLRRDGLPQPALAIGISPWTDVTNPGANMQANGAHDWVEKRMADRWADWLCRNASKTDPIVSPLRADLTGLAPIYLQAGDAEILYDMICMFATEGKRQGANVRLDTWKNMVHDFQAYDGLAPEAREALERIRAVVREHTQRS